MNRRQLFGLSALTALVSSYSQKAHAANATAKQSRYTPVQTLGVATAEWRYHSSKRHQSSLNFNQDFWPFVNNSRCSGDKFFLSLAYSELSVMS